MEDFCITLPLDKAFDCYEFTKREESKTPLYYYDFVKRDFLKIKSKMKNPGVVFINSYELCLKIINEYLNQPHMKEIKNSFLMEPKTSNNKIVNFLWFFEHIDGCHDFEKYEVLTVTRELKKWCKTNKINFTEPEVWDIKWWNMD